jgi:hypothetical protein
MNRNIQTTTRTSLALAQRQLNVLGLDHCSAELIGPDDPGSQPIISLIDYSTEMGLPHPYQSPYGDFVSKGISHLRGTGRLGINLQHVDRVGCTRCMTNLAKAFSPSLSQWRSGEALLDTQSKPGVVRFYNTPIHIHSPHNRRVTPLSAVDALTITRAALKGVALTVMHSLLLVDALAESLTSTTRHLILGEDTVSYGSKGAQAYFMIVRTEGGSLSLQAIRSEQPLTICSVLSSAL